MPNVELGIINEQIENFYNISLEERIDYIKELIGLNKVYPCFDIKLREGYRRWLFILLLMSIKTVEITQLKEFYDSLDSKGKKEFQTELYETIKDHEFNFKFDHDVDDSDKFLKQFYNFDTIDSKLEELKKECFTMINQDSHDNHEKLLNTFVERCSKNVIEDFKKSFNDYASLMKENLSNSTKKRLFSLPAHMRVYAFIKMYSTARFWNFNDGYLISNYDYRQEIRNKKKQQLKKQEDIVSNSKGYAKRKYPLIKPRV